MSSLSTNPSTLRGGGVDEKGDYGTAPQPKSPSPSTMLTQSHIQDAIQTVINTATSESNTNSKNDYVPQLQTKFGLTLRPVVNDSDWDVVDELISTSSTPPAGIGDNTKSHMRTPWYYAMTIHRNDDEEDNDLNTAACGVVTFYVSYSSWNGRVLYLDQLVVSPQADTAAPDDHSNTEISSSSTIKPIVNEEELEQLIMHVLGQITTELQFARLTWRHKETPAWHTKEGLINPEMHGEVLTLYLDQSAIDAYVDNDSIVKSKAIVPFISQTVEETIQATLEEMNKKEIVLAESTDVNSYFSFRLVTDPDKDLPIMTKLIHGLAENVQEPDAVELSSTEYTIDGLANPDPLFYCIVVDQIEGGNRRPCGYAFFYFGYEAGNGRFLYLEDLFFEPEFRGNGGGKKLMKVLSMICQSTQCNHLYWQALDWNTRGLKFYSSIGATILDGVKTSRYCDAELKAFATEDIKSFSTP